MHRLWLAGVLAATLLTSGREGVAQTGSPVWHGMSVWHGVYTAEQAERGHLVYDSACGRCHGKHLEGLAGAGLPDAPWPDNQLWRMPPLANAEFRSNWSGLPVGHLVERIRISMPQDAPGTLRRGHIVDVLAYILRQNEFPSGTNELPATPLDLNNILFEGW